MKYLFLCILISVCIRTNILSFENHLKNKHSKCILATQNSWGFCACFFNTLSGIIKCHENSKIPVAYWDKECRYYQAAGYNGKKNAWEYYFEPLSNSSYNPGDFIDRAYHIPQNSIIRDVFSQSCSKSGKNQARRNVKSYLIDRYIKIKPIIQAKINSFFYKHIKNTYTIGIHLRGTDKHTEQTDVPPLTILETANKFASKLNQPYQFFVATDQQSLLDLAVKKLKGKIIYYPSYRSKTSQAIHFTPNIPKALVGEEVLIEVILLSRCNFFIHTCSNVSIATLCFNPELENFVFLPLKITYTR